MFSYPPLGVHWKWFSYHTWFAGRFVFFVLAVACYSLFLVLLGSRCRQDCPLSFVVLLLASGRLALRNTLSVLIQLHPVHRYWDRSLWCLWVTYCPVVWTRMLRGRIGFLLECCFIYLSTGVIILQIGRHTPAVFFSTPGKLPAVNTANIHLICLFCVFVRMFVFLVVYLFTYLFGCLFVCLSVCMCMYRSLFIFDGILAWIQQAWDDALGC